MSLLLSRFSPRFNRAGYALGFGMGGFFDGILLHQILQWHHLLSALQTGVFGDVRGQVAADGFFHLLMYVISAAGLWWLYRSRAELAESAGARRLLANFWIGFGVWHVMDAVLSHWVLGIHRIRMDTAYPLVYDLVWLVIFGIVPLVAGWWLRRPPNRGEPGSSGGNKAASTLVGLTLLAGAVSLFPVARSPEGILTVVLRPGASAGPVLMSLPAETTRLLWTAPGGGVLVLKTEAPPSTLALYRHGAMYVGGAASGLGGCLDWMATDGGRSI